jgi:hypothetical protein
LPSPSTLLNISIGSTEKARRVLNIAESETEFDSNLAQLACEMKREAILDKEIGVTPEINPQLYLSIYGA